MGNKQERTETESRSVILPLEALVKGFDGCKVDVGLVLREIVGEADLDVPL